MATKGQQYKTITRDQKLKAVKMYLEEGKSMNEIEQGYLGYKKCTGAVARWVVEFKKEGEKNAFRKVRGLIEEKEEIRLITKENDIFLNTWLILLSVKI